MKTKKRCMEFISFYNHTGLEKHFAKMAKKGWLIESMSNYYWTYRRIEPQELHFCVTYYARASDFDAVASQKQQIFHEFCAHTGWQLCCTWHQMQVFCNEKENPIPLETDPVMEVETIHTACKKNYLLSQFILLALGLIQSISFIGTAIVEPIVLLSNASQLLSGFCFFCILLIAAVELISYYTWYLKAKRAAPEGIFIDTPNTAYFQRSILTLVLFGLVVWLINLAFGSDPLYFWIAILMLVVIITLHLTVNGIKLGLKKMKVSRGVNKFLTIAACFVLTFVFLSGVTWAVIGMNRAGMLKQDSTALTDLPLSLSDLADINEDQYIAENRLNQTVLLRHQVVHQRKPYDKDGTSSAPDLLYATVTVKFPMLYDWCKNQLYYSWDETNSSEWPVGNRMVFQKQDPAPWKAEEVYRLYSEEGWWTNTYLLCYEKRIISIRFDWEPTEAQMAIVSQKLNP